MLSYYGYFGETCIQIMSSINNVLCFRLPIMSNGDRLRARGQCVGEQRSVEEMRAETARIRREVERKKAELAELQRRNAIYEANCWKLDVGAEVGERAAPPNKRGA